MTINEVLTMLEKDYYKILEIEQTDDQKVIKTAYFNAVKKYPPETNPEKFAKIREAYDKLKDEETKAICDKFYKVPLSMIEEFISITSEFSHLSHKTIVKHLEKIKDIEKYPALYADLFMIYINEGFIVKAQKALDILIEIDKENKNDYYTVFIGNAIKNEKYKYAIKYAEKMINDDIENMIDGLFFLEDIYIITNNSHLIDKMIIKHLINNNELKKIYNEKQIETFITYFNAKKSFLSDDFNNLKSITIKFLEQVDSITDKSIVTKLVFNLLPLAMDLNPINQYDYYTLFEKTVLNLENSIDDNDLKEIIKNTANIYSSQKIILDPRIDNITKSYLSMMVSAEEMNFNGDIFEADDYDADVEFEFIDSYLKLEKSLNILKEEYNEIYEKYLKNFDELVSNKDKPGLLNHFSNRYPYLNEEELKLAITNCLPGVTLIKEKTIGRNDPCSCGSGKKYKKCCGKK